LIALIPLITLITLIMGVAVDAWALSAFAAPAAEPEPVEARLLIDTSKAGGGADVLHRRIEERANIVLREAKVLPGNADDAALAVTVLELQGDDPGYAVSFELRAADGSSISEPTRVECSLCTETELVARVEAELATVVATLRELGDSEPEVSSNEPPPEQRPEQPEPTPPAPTHAGMLAGGISLLVVGAGSLGAGVGLAIPEPKIDEQNPLDLITTRPVGYALIAGGIAVAATGAVLTALAVKHRRQARWSLAPLLDRTHAGVVMGWRFE
jgi:hypothetical protein